MQPNLYVIKFIILLYAKLLYTIYEWGFHSV